MQKNHGTSNTRAVITWISMFKDKINTPNPIMNCK